MKIENIESFNNVSKLLGPLKGIKKPTSREDGLKSAIIILDMKRNLDTLKQEVIDNMKQISADSDIGALLNFMAMTSMCLDALKSAITKVGNLDQYIGAPGDTKLTKENYKDRYVKLLRKD